MPFTTSGSSPSVVNGTRTRSIVAIDTGKPTAVARVPWNT